MSEQRLTQTEVSLNQTGSDLVNIKVNGIPVQVPKGENVIEAARRAGVDIPYFCYHPRLSKGDAANCRMCLVEVAMPRKNPDGTEVLAKMPKPQTGCTLPAAEGMEIQTETPGIVRDRKGVLEFLLINHPLDCPICDRGGECPLQNNTLFYGPETSRYIEEKRHFPKAYPLSEQVVFDRERCIHCARCTRFTEDISGDAQLGFLKRGADLEVGTYAQTSFQSKFSGNVIELCPVGALLSRTYRFKARPWDLHTQKSVCSKCSNGCNIKLDYRLNSLQRVNGRLNEAVNEEWTCDRGKFGHDYVNSPKRLLKPLLKRDGAFVPVEWSEAYKLLAEKLKAANGSVGGIGGYRNTNEDLFAFQKFFREVLKSNHLDSRIGRYGGSVTKPLFERFGYYTMGNPIADLETMKTIFVLGSSLADEQPILFLRIRKAWRFRGASVIHANTFDTVDTTKVSDFAASNLLYKPGTEKALLYGLLNLLLVDNTNTVEMTPQKTALARAAADYPLDKAAEVTGLAEADILKAAKLLAVSPTAFLVGKTVTESPDFLAIMEALGDLAEAAGNEKNLNVPGFDVNSQGALELGILPDFAPGFAPLASPGLNTQAMLRSAANGELPVLWVLGAKLIENYPDRELAQTALSNAFVVVSELEMTETAQYADLILPAASFAEKEGTFTNCESRVQRVYKAFDIEGDVKPDWLIFTELASQMGANFPFFSARDITLAIAKTVSTFAGTTPKALGDAGLRLQHSTLETGASKTPLTALNPMPNS